jgi:hypothetical protein
MRLKKSLALLSGILYFVSLASTTVQLAGAEIILSGCDEIVLLLD